MHFSLFSLYQTEAEPSGNQAIACDGCYGAMAPSLYLTGQFEPSHHPSFVSATAAGIDDHGRGVLLRKETATALKLLQNAIQRDLPGQSFWIQSGTRNYISQKSIWESKWNGSTPVGGIRLNTVRDPMDRARRILTYSSMPGTSRHHWGTDFDINQLTVEYYTTGPGKRLYAWMLKNAPTYGFCLVYTPDRSGGYDFEPWHWSYKPLSSRFLKDWELLYRQGKILSSRIDFSGARDAFALAPVYAGSVNRECR